MWYSLLFSLPFSSFLLLVKRVILDNNLSTKRWWALWESDSKFLESRSVITYFMSQFSSVQFSHSVTSDSLQPHESQHTRPPCPSPTPQVHSDSCPSSQWCHPAISTLGIYPEKNTVWRDTGTPCSQQNMEGHRSNLNVHWQMNG